MDDDYKIEVIVSGPEKLAEGRSFPSREMLARLEVPVDSATAWHIYTQAVSAAVSTHSLSIPPELLGTQSEIRR